MLTKLWPKVARGEEITLEEHKARNAAGLAALRTQWRASLIVAPSADAMPPWNILRIPACLNQQPSPKAHLRSGLQNLREFLFLEIWSRAILFLRPPMTRIRRGQALPEPTPHASRRRRAESSTARGRLSQIAEAARPSRIGGRETFPPCKPLKTNETELESRQILPVRRTPMRRRRLSGRTERSSRPGQSVASSRSRTLAASSSKENGLPIRCTPASSRP